MSRLLGGPFSRASGKVAGLVFSSARSGLKKMQTIREHVVPSNPRTATQVAQRGRMAYAAAIVVAIGQAIYRFDWNRAVRQLAGYPSLINLFISNIDRMSGELSQPRNISLGVRHFPATFSVEAGTGQVEVTWSTEAGAVSHEDDEAVAILVAKDPDPDAFTREVQVKTGATRADGATGYTFTTDNDAPGDVFVCLYFRNSGESIPDRDRRSDARWLASVSGD